MKKEVGLGKILVSLLTLCSLLAGLAIFDGPAAFAQTLFEKARLESFSKLGAIPKPPKPFRLGVVLITLANPYWVTMKEGYENAAKELEIQIDIQAAPQENSLVAQLDLLENMVAKGYDAICAHTITAQNLIPGLVKANQKGVLVVTDKRVDLKSAREAGANPVVISLVDYYDQGKLGGEFLCREIGKKGGGKVAIIEGLPGAPQSEDRRNGAREAFSRCPSLQLVSVQPGNWDRMKAYHVATNLIQAHPDLKGIFCANDVMALAAVEAIELAGKKGQVSVVGVDLIAQAKEAIAQGRLAASVSQSPFIIGEMFARVALAASLGKKIPDHLSIINTVASRDNMDQLKDWK